MTSAAGPIATPSREDLARARRTFAAREPRDLFYRAATGLIEMAWSGRGKLSLAEALGVLLQTWNVSFYRFHKKFDSEHLFDLETLTERLSPAMIGYRARSLQSLSDEEEQELIAVFEAGESVLGAVGTAKAYHLLAPMFFPIWDRRIAQAYRCGLGPVGQNGSRYVRFARITKDQVEAMQKAGYCPDDPLKALDEYNYCVYTNKWPLT